MERLAVGSAQIAYADSMGEGDPLLLLHGGLLSDWFVPVAADPRLAGCRVVRMERAGYVRPEDATVPFTIAERAAHGAELLAARGITRAYVGGHSSGAIIALQMALDFPDLVAGLVLIEPAPGGELASATAIDVAQGPMRASMERFAAGDAEAGYDLFMRATCVADHADVLEGALGPGALARAIEQSRAFPAEAAAFADWTFGAAEGERLTTPVLAIAGTATEHDCPLPPDSVPRLQALVPQTEIAWLPGGNHMMTLTDPSGVSELIGSFVARNPIPAPAGREG